MTPSLTINIVLKKYIFFEIQDKEYECLDDDLIHILLISVLWHWRAFPTLSQVWPLEWCYKTLLIAVINFNGFSQNTPSTHHNICSSAYQTYLVHFSLIEATIGTQNRSFGAHFQWRFKIHCHIIITVHMYSWKQISDILMNVCCLVWMRNRDV